ncbi:MAG: oligosaccharide flippase family protein, partial [Burkholderiaceae bacterium]
MKQAIAKGAMWMVLFKLAERSLGLISVVVLARLLVPADFGLVAMAMSIIGFIDIATTFGFDIALIQRPNPERKDYD